MDGKDSCCYKCCGFTPLEELFPKNTTAVPPMVEPIKAPIRKVIQTYEYDKEGRCIRSTSEEY